METFVDSLTSPAFMPHGHCYYWQPDILWSHALADGTIATAYFAIPLVLFYLFAKRRNTHYSWVVALFALFIVGCGITHVMDVVTIWNPLYRLDSLFRIITALASVGTAIALAKITPQLLAIPTAAEWRRHNDELQAANEELRVTNEELVESRHFIHKVMNTIPNSIYLFDLTSYQAIYTNKDLLVILGYSQSEAPTPGPAVMKKLVHPDDSEKRMQYYRDFSTAEDGERREIEFRLRHADGNYRHYLFTNAVFRRNAAGVPDQTIGVSQDITALKQTEENLRNTLHQLREANEELSRTEETLQELNNELEERVEHRTRELAESNERYELVAQATNDAVWDRTYSQRGVRWNRAFEQLFGYLTPEEKAHPTVDAWLQRVHPQDLTAILDLIKHSVATASPVWQVEYRFQRADGRYAYVLGRGVILYGEDRRPRRMLGSLTDITSLKETQLSLLQQNQQLQKINSDLDNFIYLASHDLKQPVVNLEGLLSLLRGNLPAQLAAGNEKLFSFMEASAGRLKRTIYELTEISRIQQEAPPDAEEIAIPPLVDEVWADLAGLVAQAGGRLETDFPVASIHYSARYMRSILYNLLSNALKYRAPERAAVVRVATRLEGDRTRLTVADNGLGLSEQQQSNLFVMFKRLHTHGEGSGVGLYMIKRMVENNGGEISVASREGQGSTFTVYFSNKAGI
ncbi:MAG: PAS domain-containing protein [Ferruginibacter sp.]|nr:PAS domain-containing protein [Cytophagales bacterium]